MKDSTLDVTVSERGDRLRVRLSGALDAADLADARHAFARLPALRARAVDLEVGDEHISTRGSVVLDHFCKMIEDAGGRVALSVSSATAATLRAVALPGDPQPAPETPDLLERTARFQKGLKRALIEYLTIFRQTLATTVSGLSGRSRFSWDDFFLALMQTGVRALPLIALISTLIGAILALQAGPFFARFGQEMLVAQLVALSVLREIGPLLTAILVAGRSGSSLAAEIGTMKVSEEIDAIEVMGSSPVRVLIAPRFLGLLCALPCLVFVADVLGIAGGLLVGKLALDIPSMVYLDETRKAVKLEDLVGGLVKAIAYAVVIVTIAAHQGFATKGGAAGVGRHTTRSVVSCILWIIVVDAFFTWILYIMDL